MPLATKQRRGLLFATDPPGFREPVSGRSKPLLCKGQRLFIDTDHRAVHFLAVARAFRAGDGASRFGYA